MTDLETFRLQTRAWLEDHAPASLRDAAESRGPGGFWGGRRAKDAPADERRWLEVMAERGWTAPTWPKAYGGGGLSAAEARVVDEERRRLQMPPPLVGFGLKMIGPTLLRFGTEAQKQEHIPKIVRGEIRWCQGYSEPGSGSDLASLQTRAVLEEGEYVINGQKVWTSYADQSDWIFCLVRTDPAAKKQAGITFILFDMDQPGITVRPIPLISGASPFCEVFFENARARPENVIHEVNAGWTVAKALLQHERAWIGELFAGSVAGAREELVGLAREYLGAPEGPIPDALTRDAITRVAMEEDAFLLTLERAAQLTRAAGGRPGPESSVLKTAGTELNQERCALAVQLAGPQALGWEGPGFTDRELTLARTWLRSRGNTIEGGTTEIQLNIIAKHVLGLPD
ncbi:MAG: acyl-CoA dehydrogenase family protein [Myxococcales bacterium]|nr:acyl-CoA dehydrogenase family protein [Myxococcales bacterium]